MIDNHANIRSTLTTLIALTAVVPLLVDINSNSKADIAQNQHTVTQPFTLTPPLINVTR
ncbi:hypothetical protein SAMN06273572_10568 [Monaibacterium marinum]|uniref:Uncharacterized protein n=1 Tax=Pontivivens marinum TaxID=1690039 RepID=A0A2C9CTQ5_9RHOB|nr:hypothetical protein SAMN06273572_10568 [Monaibacterium marinum]